MYHRKTFYSWRTAQSCLINSASNIHGPNALNVLHQWVASPAAWRIGLSCRYVLLPRALRMMHPRAILIIQSANAWCCNRRLLVVLNEKDQLSSTPRPFLVSIDMGKELKKYIRACDSLEVQTQTSAVFKPSPIFKLLTFVYISHHAYQATRQRSTSSWLQQR